MSFLIYRREVVTTSGSGKGGNNRRRPFRRRDRDDGGQNGRSPNQDNQSRQDRNSSQSPRAKNPQGELSRSFQGNQRRHDSPHFDKNRGIIIDRPKWVSPKISTEPLPAPDCPWCGKPIRDIASAIADKDTGEPVHFECVAVRIAQGETLEKGDTVTYIGGGRFGIVSFGGPEAQGRGEGGKNFTIKKIIEWENKDNRAEWRSTVSDHYSVT